MSLDEVARLSAALAESINIGSRAEFFIRVGCSGPNVEVVARELGSLASGHSEAFEVDLAVGLEQEENPRRSRPPR